MQAASNTSAIYFKILIVMICLTLLSVMATPIAAKGKPGDGADPAWIEFNYTGAITGSVSCEDKLGANPTILGCNHTGGFTLGSEIIAAVGTDCFDEGFTPGTIQVFLNNDGSADAWFRFHAPDKLGSDILYRLEAHDSNGWVGPFPPELTNPPSVTTMASEDWTLRASNHKQEKYACLGGGEDFIGVTVERLP